MPNALKYQCTDRSPKIHQQLQLATNQPAQDRELELKYQCTNRSVRVHLSNPTNCQVLLCFFKEIL